MVAVEADDVGDLAPRLLRLRARQVDLVDDRDDLEVVLDGEVRVGERLRLDALRRVDEQQRAFAGGERPRHFVREVDVARRVDQVQDVLLARLRRVVQADRVRLDRDAALALEVHGVEDLRFHLARLERAGDLEEAVGQRRLAVVDVRDDREVSDVSGIHASGRLIHYDSQISRAVPAPVPRAYASYAVFPPTTVRTILMSLIFSGSTVCGSSASTTKSASLPGGDRSLDRFFLRGVGAVAAC